jgi:Na+/melibiose symporter-like transporter
MFLTANSNGSKLNKYLWLIIFCTICSIFALLMLYFWIIARRNKKLMKDEELAKKTEEEQEKKSLELSQISIQLSPEVYNKEYQ